MKKTAKNRFAKSITCEIKNWKIADKYNTCSLTSSILVAQVRKSPDVAKTDGVTKTTEQEVESSGPVAALLVLVFGEVLREVTFVLLRNTHTNIIQLHTVDSISG